jgi:hypothetical protein
MGEGPGWRVERASEQCRLVGWVCPLLLALQQAWGKPCPCLGCCLLPWLCRLRHDC